MRLPLKLTELLDRHGGSLRRLSWVMGSALISRAAQLVVMVIIARRLGPTDYGQFVFAIGTAAVAGSLGNLGWQFSFNRFYALARRQPDRGELDGLMRASARVNLAGAFAAATILAAAGLFADELGYGLLAAAALTVPWAVMLLKRQQLAGTKQSAIALMLDQGLAALVLLGAVLSFRLSLGEMLAVYGSALIAGNLAAVWLVRRKLPTDLVDAPARYDWRTWMGVSLTLMQARLARILLARIDVILLPALASLSAAGIYGAAFRLTYVLTFPQFVLQTINGPQFAEAFAAGRPDRVRRILKRSLLYALVTSLPWLILFVAIPERIMTFLFGPQFAAGAVPLVLIAIGQFALSLSSPFNAILVSGGAERKMALLSYGVLVPNIALSFALIPLFGAIGAAIVVALSGFAILAGQAWFVRNMLKASKVATG